MGSDERNHKNAFQEDAVAVCVTVGGGMSARGGGCLPRGCVSGSHPPPPGVDRMTGVKTIPCRNHVADGKNLGKNWLSVHTVERLDKSPCSFSSNTTKKDANDFSYTPTA